MENLELFVPLPIDDDNGDDAWVEFTDIFFYSLHLFWPLNNTRMVVVAESNRPEAARQKLIDRVRVATEKAHLAGGRVAFNVAPKGQEDELGYFRQYRMMFFGDNYTDAEFVGFCDSDTVFTGVVQEQDLFDEQRRPRIIGLYGRPTDANWANSPNVTFFALGMPEPFRHMDQFPVIIRTAHLKEIRDHITRHVGTKDFDEAFTMMRDIANPVFCQYNIMATYLWHKHRDMYSWHVQELEPGWNFRAPIGQAPHTPEHMATLGPYLNPLPRIASHWHHENKPTKETKAGWLSQNDQLLHLMRDGVCSCWPSTAGGEAPSFCHGIKYPNGFSWQWVFERHDWSWHQCAPLAGHLRHERMVKREWPEEILKTLSEFDTNYTRDAGSPAGPLSVGVDPGRRRPRPGRISAQEPALAGPAQKKMPQVSVPVSSKKRRMVRIGPQALRNLVFAKSLQVKGRRGT
eukprot:jgi/Mesvir1/10017/Mv26160-RA.1